MPVPRRCLLAAAMIAALGCGKGPEAPHGSPVLLQVMWEVKGVPTRIWSRDADAAVATVVPPQGTRVDFVFDRRLDGARIEDTVNDLPVPKANPPVTAGWPDMDTVMSDPPFAANVLYNSLPDWGPATTYAFLTPHLAGFPAATTITFTLDPNGLTSVYGEPMDGPTAITVNTGAFTVSLPNSTASAPTDYRVPIVFSTRAPRDQTLKPFIHVLAGVTPLPFDLRNDNGDTTLVSIIPTPTGCSGWPPSTEITIFADQGLPDAFGRPLTTPVAGRFVTSPIGGCGGNDAGVRDATAGDTATDGTDTTDAGTNDAGTNDAGTNDGAADDGAPDDGAPDDAPQSN